MAQNSEAVLSEIRYTRADFTALRAYLNRIPVGEIRQRYYTEYDLEILKCASDADLRQRIEDMRERLVYSATIVNPHIAEILRNARRSGGWSPKLINFLVQAADQDLSTPKKHDSISAWLKPRLAAVLAGESVKTLADLIALIEARGVGWWKPIPLIGPGKARRIENWLGKHATTLGALRKTELLIIPGELVILSPDNPILVPLERIMLPTDYNGSVGLNRNTSFCLVSARNDWQAIEAYLYKFRGQEKTRRSYQKELERFLLWCIYQRRIPVSSVLTDDCEAYKDFIADLPEAWIGRKGPRSTANWRPFAGPLTPASQKYAIQAIRFFFSWLVNVRYLMGNPWVTVSNPRVATALHSLQIEKALPEVLWEKLAGADGILDTLCATPDDKLRRRYRLRGSTAHLSMSAQFRLVRAALLLMGNCGIRREELAWSTRDKLKPVPRSDLWELDILGKRNKWRTVYPPTRAIKSIQAHWQDRGLDFSYGLADLPLLSPLNAPNTPWAQGKHVNSEGQLKESGFSPDGIYKLVKAALKRIAEDDAHDLELMEREQLLKTAPHAFRHTFGTQTVAGDVPLDVVQKLLGHSSLQTTTIYVQAEKKRSISEMGAFFSRRQKK